MNLSSTIIPKSDQRHTVTQSELQALFNYDPESGHFQWIVSRRGRNLNRPAGTVDAADGYCRIRIGGRPYAAHRLAWLYVHGEWPSSVIDHIDGDRSNNRLANLRPATLQQNQFNRRVKRTSSTGSKGVSLDRRSGRFQVAIKIGGVKRWVGYFDTVEEGSAAYNEIAETIHGEFFKRTAP